MKNIELELLTDIYELVTVEKGIKDRIFHAVLEHAKANNNKKYNCSEHPAFKSPRVGYHSNQTLLHH